MLLFLKFAASIELYKDLPYSPGEKCTFNLKRVNDTKSAATFKQYQTSPKQFSDKSFPASTSSLYLDLSWRDIGQNLKLVSQYKTANWLRPTDLVRTKEGPSLWGKYGVQPADVASGQLDDSWFLASAAAIAEKPVRIYPNFVNSEYDKSGIFGLNFYHMGQSVQINIDDKLAFKSDKTAIHAQQTALGGWWLSLLEKAYAKYNVNYSQLAKGTDIEAMRALTGMPIMVYSTKN